MKKHLLPVFLVFFSLNAFPQNTGNINGSVTDARSGAPLIGVTVQIGNSLNGTSTDINGKFSFRNMKVGAYDLSVSYVGFKTKTITAEVSEGRTETLTIRLEESVIGLSEITIEAESPVSAASSKEIRRIELQLKPVRTSQDMLLMVPGLFIAQHQGGGKAEQIFLRGFDCDHGTDVSINVDGMPVNMVTNAHGQGYADLHFLISETVDEMEVNKGPYLAYYGDFYTAGAVNFRTKDLLQNNLVKAEAGQFNTQKYTVLLQPDKGNISQNGYLALQYHHSDGPFISPEKYERMNIFGKYYFQLTPNSKLTLSASGFSTGWNASGQIPERAVENGIIGRFGGLDNMEGGITNRKNFNVVYKFLSPKGNELEVNTYYTNYNFKLYSNFTYLLNDPVNGDMIEQNEHRSLQGANLSYKIFSSISGFKQLTRLGGCYRSDLIDVQLWHSPERIRMESFTGDIIDEVNLNVWIQHEITFSPSFRIIGGLRHDLFTFSKDDQVADSFDPSNNGLPHASGVSHQSVISPKLNLIYSFRNVDLFLNFGQGFHSNDARDVVIGKRVSELSSQFERSGFNDMQIDSALRVRNFEPGMRFAGTLPKATAYELGFKSRMFDKLYLTCSGWYMYLDKEYVYAGDGGTTELSNPTTRLGIDAEARLSIFPWLWADLDLSAARASITGLPEGSNYVPLAPTFIASGGINIVREQGFNCSLRIRHLSNRPANEDYSVTAPGHTLYNLVLAYSLGNISFSLNGENLTDTSWNEAQFATETRIPGEADSITDLCYTPGNPRNFQFGISYKF
jgi:outer membrane receptor protein involved in Fe transport